MPVKKAPLPKGFSLAVGRAGIKGPGLPKGRNDLALILSETDASLAGVFTTNKVKGAPVVMNMARAKKGQGRAILVNSGNSNSCTGKRGMRDAREMAAVIAKGLGVKEGHVCVCSTGVIGVPMPMERIRPALEKLAVSPGGATVEKAARAIMTTDSFPKLLSRTVKVGAKTGRITAFCKGAGMIEPDMATMLCFVMTDLKVGSGLLRSALKSAVADSFNMLTVDGDQSTSDSVLLMANGASGAPALTRGSAGYKRFSSALNDICLELASMMARDGEGATKLVNVIVKGARSVLQARKAAKAVANSLLVKTAIHGADPNWGRILPVLGRGGIDMNPDRVDVYIGRVKIASKGLATGNGKKAASELKKSEVDIRIELKSGSASARAITCDLTAEYVRINSEYTT